MASGLGTDQLFGVPAGLRAERAELDKREAIVLEMLKERLAAAERVKNP